ncbi:MAG: amidohydrolase family protein [Bdellovibrionaceae bacterium]|nr:amidohydrolase family protein [Pseudobdellovibrionaceae bacterium]
MILRNLYDSHCHLLDTGEAAMGLSLSAMLDPEELRELEIKKEWLRGDWLYGFGWNENNFVDRQLPSISLLDELFPDRPVLLSRADGHSSWVNSEALRRIGFLSNNGTLKDDPPGGQILRGADGAATGILRESAHIRALRSLPPLSSTQVRDFLLKAQEIFHRAGFTHVREMTCRPLQWSTLLELEHSGDLKLFVENNFVCEGLDDFDSVLKFAKEAKSSEGRFVKAVGIKLFVDGSLGSDTALLSRPYGNKPETTGLQLWPDEVIEEVIRRTWDSGLEVALHTIGDAAVDKVVEIARKIYNHGGSGWLNLEHVEVLRPETIQKMKSLHVRCHLQPCHWLSDKKFLDEKLGELKDCVFPWRPLEAAKVEMQFGSDSPIERPDAFANLRAVRESAGFGIAPLKGDFWSYHQHKDSPVHGETICHGKEIKSVCFDGKIVYAS